MRSNSMGMRGARLGLSALAIWASVTVEFARTDEPAAAGPPPHERILAGDDAARAEELARGIDEREQAGDFAGAVELAEELVELRQRAQGTDHYEAVDARWRVDTLRRLMTFNDEQRDSWQTAMRDERQAAESTAQGMYQQALALRETCLGRIRSLWGDEHPHTSRAYNQVAVALFRLGRFDEAAPLLERSLEIDREALGEQHPATAAAYLNLASAHLRLGRLAEAETRYRRAIEIKLLVLGQNDASTASAYNNLGALFRDQGRHAEADVAYRQALAIRLRLHGESHADTAASYNNIAANLADEGKHAEADWFFRRALDLRRGLLGDGHPDTVESLNNLAFNLNAQLKHADAEPLFRQALEARGRLYGENHPFLALGYNNLGGCLHSQGKLVEAEEMHRKALELRRATFGDQHLETAMSQAHVAAILDEQQRHPEAEELFRQVLNTDQKLLGDSHPDTATACNNLAFNLVDQARDAEAAPLFDRALSIWRATLGDQHPKVVNATRIAGLRAYRNGDAEHAMRMLRDAAAAHEAARLRFSARGLDRALFGAAGNPYPWLAALEADQGRPSDAWRALELHLARGLADEAALRRGRELPPDEEAERRVTLDELDQLNPRILQLATGAFTDEERKLALPPLLRLRAGLEARLSRLATSVSQREVASLEEVQASLPEDAAVVAWIDLEETGAGGEAHWACVLRSSGAPVWTRLPGRAQAPDGPDGTWTAEDRSLAKNLVATMRQSGSPADVAALIDRLAAQRLTPLLPHLTGVRHLHVVSSGAMAGVPVELLTDDFTVSYVHSGTQMARLKATPRAGEAATLLALGDPIYEAESAPRSTSTALPPGGLLVDQVISEGNAAQSGLRSGDVLLAYAGKELTTVEQLLQLVEEHSDEQTVIVRVWRETEEQPTDRELRSGRLGVALARQPAPQAIARRRELDRLLVQRGGWQDLPGTRVEVARLASLFGDAHVSLLTDADASEQRLTELSQSGELSRFRYLHLAAHGEANNTMAFESALILSQDRLPTPDDLAAGATDFDGRLTAQEVLDNWRLNADLVTFSACESGLGREGGGDGLLGFAQALLLAGGRSVCLSLWKVDDSATALLMDRFYQNLLGKRSGLDQPLPKAEALAEAKQWLRELTVAEAAQLAAELTGAVARGAGRKTPPLLPPPPPFAEDADTKPYSHPKYWAAFVLFGDPQ